MTVADKDIERLISEAVEVGRKRIEERNFEETERQRQKMEDMWRPHIEALKQFVPDWVIPHVSGSGWNERGLGPYGDEIYYPMLIVLPGCEIIRAWVRYGIAYFKVDIPEFPTANGEAQVDIERGERDFYVALAQAKKTIYEEDGE